MPTVPGWWAGRSDFQRIDLYTRWTFYGSLAMGPFLALLVVVGSVQDLRDAPAAAYLAGSLAVTVAAVLLARAGLDAHLQDGPLPWRPAAVAAGLAVATAGAGLATFPAGVDDVPSLVAPWSMALPLTVVLTACAAAWPARALAVGGAASGALIGSALVATGRPVGAAVLQCALLGATATAVAQSFRFTVWVLEVVVQLDRARLAQARLAVAEERLRFARDLHDVMGRNLAAISVKSQLAAELVRRGRAQAAQEVADISRIADESLREVRGVVGGYREVTLAGELAGARALLRAAGVDCTVTGDQEGPRLPSPVQTALGWVVREAVTNVLRHSRATTCSISLQVDERDCAQLRVVNDGAGPLTGLRWGNGLTGVGERLRACGGLLSATRQDGDVVLTATLPVRTPV